MFIKTKKSNFDDLMMIMLLKAKEKKKFCYKKILVLLFNYNFLSYSLLAFKDKFNTCSFIRLPYEYESSISFSSSMAKCFKLIK